MSGLKMLEPQGESSARVEVSSGSIKVGSHAVPGPAMSLHAGRMSAADRELLLRVDIDPSVFESASQETIDGVVRLAANVLTWQAQAEATEREIEKLNEHFRLREEFMQKLAKAGLLKNGRIDKERLNHLRARVERYEWNRALIMHLTLTGHFSPLVAHLLFNSNPSEIRKVVKWISPIEPPPMHPAKVLCVINIALPVGRSIRTLNAPLDIRCRLAKGRVDYAKPGGNNEEA